MATRLNTHTTTSGVTRVGDTRGGNWGCHPFIFSWKNWWPFLVASSAVSPLISSSQKLTTFLLIALSLLLLSLGCHPLEGVTLHLFYLSDLVSPLFFVNLPSCPQFFSFGCHPLEGVTRGGPPSPCLPLVTPLTTTTTTTTTIEPWKVENTILWTISLKVGLQLDLLEFV